MSEQNPTVSIIIPCYNQGQYLDGAVNSVLAQTYQDFEIIVVNDGSTDPETVEILKTYNQPKTTIIHTDNQGLPLARNNGIQVARGRYILPLDADDKIGNTYLQEALELLEDNDNLGIVYCEAEFFGEQEGKWALPEYEFPNILLRNVIFCSGFFRKSDWQEVGGYNPNMIYGWEDYDFWLSIIELGREVYRIPKILFFYRRQAVSMAKSLNPEKYIKCHTQIFNNHQKLYAEHISTIFTEVVDFRGQVESAKVRIKKLEDHEKYLGKRIKKLEKHKKYLEKELDRAQVTIQEMEKLQIVLLFKIKKLVKKFLSISSTEGWNVALKKVRIETVKKLVKTFTGKEI